MKNIKDRLNICKMDRSHEGYEDMFHPNGLRLKHWQNATKFEC